MDKRVIDVFTAGHCFIYQNIATIRPETLPHNVPNCGYHIWIGDGSVFYATDTATLDGIEAKGYDLYMIEANHVKEELEARRDAKVTAGEYAYEFNAARNHMSREQAEDWLPADGAEQQICVFAPAQGGLQCVIPQKKDKALVPFY